MACYLKLAITQDCHFCGQPTGNFGVADDGEDTFAFCRPCGQENGLGEESGHDISDYEWDHELRWHELALPARDDLKLVTA